jgi:AraC family transcriptional regulator
MVTHLVPSPRVPPVEETNMVAGHALKLLLASDAQSWQGLSLHYYRATTKPEFAAAPAAISDHVHSIVLQVRGSVDLHCRADGHTSRARSAPGGICTIPLGSSIAFSWVGSAQICHMYLTPALLTAVADDVGRSDPTRIELARHFDIRDLLIEQIGLALIDELASGGYAGRLYAESLSCALALQLLRQYSSFAVTRAPSTQGLTREELSRVTDYIHDRLDQNLSLAELAAVVHFSPAHFTRYFKHAVGLAPHQYLVRCRVERARGLLLESTATIAAVAQQVGFADHSHLTRHFKRILGISPKLLIRGKNILNHARNIQDDGDREC